MQVISLSVTMKSAYGYLLIIPANVEDNTNTIWDSNNHQYCLRRQWGRGVDRLTEILGFFKKQMEYIYTRKMAFQILLGSDIDL